MFYNLHFKNLEKKSLLKDNKKGVTLIQRQYEHIIEFI